MEYKDFRFFIFVLHFDSLTLSGLEGVESIYDVTGDPEGLGPKIVPLL